MLEEKIGKLKKDAESAQSYIYKRFLGCFLFLFALFIFVLMVFHLTDAWRESDWRNGFFSPKNSSFHDIDQVVLHAFPSEFAFFPILILLFFFATFHGIQYNDFGCVNVYLTNHDASHRKLILVSTLLTLSNVAMIYELSFVLPQYLTVRSADTSTVFFEVLVNIVVRYPIIGSFCYFGVWTLIITAPLWTMKAYFCQRRPRSQTAILEEQLRELNRTGELFNPD